VGLVTFDITAHLVYPPSTSYGNGTLNADIGAIACQSNTNTISALELAYQQIRAVNLPLAENTIMLFTDGSPNGISANFPLRTSLDSRWGPALANPAPPAQAGSTFGHNNSCNDVGPQDANNVNEEAICINMPVECTTAGTVRGTLAQWGGRTRGGQAVMVWPSPLIPTRLRPSLQRVRITAAFPVPMSGSSSHTFRMPIFTATPYTAFAIPGYFKPTSSVARIRL
jgi:hypothetical protein